MQDRKVQEEVGLNPGIPKRNHPKWKVNAMSVRNLTEMARLGKTVAEDEDMALFGEGEEKVERMWEKQLCLILPRKKIPFRHWARWASQWNGEFQRMDC